MNGEVQKAAELYLQVKSKTTNGVVWLEMDRFFRGYKAKPAGLSGTAPGRTGTPQGGPCENAGNV